MVFFNYATMQMAAKIVYYGPGLCGKTTNLHHIYGRTSPQSRGEMVSLETETDRTLFFDLLPLDVGVVGGFKTRLQLYTVPGQVFYNTTRKLVLKGADGIVFVADSQKPMLEANVESLKNLAENLKEIGIELNDLPLVIQLNKRDLPNVLDVETMKRALDPDGRYDFVEASAVNGNGVFETLKTISKLTLKALRRRMMGDEVKAPARPAAAPAARPPAATPVFTVHQEPPPAARPQQPHPLVSNATMAVEMPREVASAAATAVADEDASAAPAEAAQSESATPLPPAQAEPVPETAPLPETTDAPAEALFDEEISDEEISVDEMSVEVEEEPFPAEPAAPAEIAFSESEKPAEEPPAVKRVKVRNTVDIIAELEQLRKNATQGPSRGKVDVLSALDALTGTKSKRDLAKNVSLSLTGDQAAKSRKVWIAISFISEDGGTLLEEERTVELDRSDWNNLQLNVKIDTQAE
jgi:mutual gliding-motility protein MglA